MSETTHPVAQLVKAVDDTHSAFIDAQDALGQKIGTRTLYEDLINYPAARRVWLACHHMMQHGHAAELEILHAQITAMEGLHDSQREHHAAELTRLRERVQAEAILERYRLCEPVPETPSIRQFVWDVQSMARRVAELEAAAVALPPDEGEADVANALREVSHAFKWMASWQKDVRASVERREISTIAIDFTGKASEMLPHIATIGAELTRLAAALREREADAMGVTNVLGFFASAIKCGDPWTDEREKMLRKAFAHRDAARTTEGA